MNDLELLTLNPLTGEGFGREVSAEDVVEGKRFASGSSAANFAPVEINEKAFQWDGNLPLGNHIGPGQAWDAWG